MSTKEEDNGKESKEPDYDEDKQEEEKGEIEQETTNQTFWTFNCNGQYFDLASIKAW